MSTSCRKRVRALNDGAADEVDWRNVYGVFESRPTQRGGARSINPRSGNGRRNARGNARGRGGNEPSAPELITVFQLQRQRQIMQNSAILQQEMGEFHNMMQRSTFHFHPATLGGVGRQPPPILQHLPPLGHALMRPITRRYTCHHWDKRLLFVQ